MGYSVQSIGQWTTWTPSFTGFSSSPTISYARYTVNGKMCTASLKIANTTSNAATLTVTLPFAAANTDIQSFNVTVVDNGSFQTSPGKLNTQANSNIADVYKTLASGTFTASGTKSVLFTITYEIA